MPAALDGDRAFAPVSTATGSEPRACPRCRSPRFKRNGCRRTGQRYFCHACRRSFNARTGTPLARLRCAQERERFRRGFDAVRPLRQDAQALGVSVATVWKWRHERLAELVEHEEALPTLTGAVAVDPLVVSDQHAHWCSPAHWSHRREPRYRRPDGVRPDFLFFLAEVEPPGDIAHLVERGRNRRVVLFAPETLLGEMELGGLLADRLTPGSWADTVRGRLRILPPGPAGATAKDASASEPPSAKGAPCGERGRSLRMIGVGKSGRRACWEWPHQRGERFHTARARELRRTFIQWMARFRGVRFSYLDRYVAWFNTAVATRPEVALLA